MYKLQNMAVELGRCKSENKANIAFMIYLPLVAIVADASRRYVTQPPFMQGYKNVAFS